MRACVFFFLLGGCSVLFPSDDFQGGDGGVDAGCVPSACPSGRCDGHECAPVCNGESCVNATDVSATAQLESPNFQLELVVGVPVQSEQLDSPNYSLRLELETEF